MELDTIKSAMLSFSPFYKKLQRCLNKDPIGPFAWILNVLIPKNYLYVVFCNTDIKLCDKKWNWPICVDF